jgi:long-chain acyl-CoA synthetase
MLTHRNLSPTCSSPARGWAPTSTTARNLIITALPLYHIFALTANCLVFMKFGGSITADHQSARHAGLRQGAVGAFRFTAITGVNTLFNGLLNTPGFDQLDFSRLNLTLGGGMAVQRAVADAGSRSPACTLSRPMA